MHFIWTNEQTVPLPQGIGAVFARVFACAQDVACALRDMTGVVCVTLIDERTMRALNATYRHIDRPTDVLSFASLDVHEKRGAVARIDASERSDGAGVEDEDGEIMICVAVAALQAGEKGTSLEHELALLFVHGLLHIIGYDHADEVTERDMFSRQAAILRAAGYGHDGD